MNEWNVPSISHSVSSHHHYTAPQYGPQHKLSDGCLLTAGVVVPRQWRHTQDFRNGSPFTGKSILCSLEDVNVDNW
jgi:hypothetical protein